MFAAVGALVLAAAGYAAWVRTGPPRLLPTRPQPGPEWNPPRQGVQKPPEQSMDEAHAAAVRAFPARTDGLGGQRLSYRTENGVKVFELEARVVQWEVEPGVRKEAWAYNGVVPGPEIRVDEGDRVRVILRNRLPESTSIHWHGQRLIGQNDQDGVTYLTQDPIKPGQTYTYEFTADTPGTHMYHAHHNSTKQIALGLLGPLIVEPRDKSKQPKFDREYTLVLNDGPLGFTINGKSFPATQPIVAKKGERILLCWMHEGALTHPMHVHGLKYEVVAKDGYPLPQPFFADTLVVNPGERYDTIVVADNPGKWALHCHVLPHAEGERGLLGLTTVVVVEE